MKIGINLAMRGGGVSVPTIDFSAGVLDPRILYTRAGSVNGAGGSTPNASKFNAAGTLAFANRHEPRIDYDPVTHAIKGLLVEPAQSNLILDSTTATNWSVGGSATLAVSFAVAPDGTTTASKCTPGVGTLTPFVNSATATVVNGTVYQQDIFVKVGSGVQWIYLLLFDGSSKNAWFDIVNGVVGSKDAGVSNQAIQSIGNGWYRITAARTSTGVSWIHSVRCSNADGGTTFTGDGSKNFLLWGGSLHATPVDTADTFIPTPTGAVASAVTRAAEVAKVVLNSTAPLTYTFDDATQQTVTPGATGLYTIPTNLNRRWVKKIEGGGMAPATRKVVVHGDSITAGFLASKPYWAGAIEGCYTDHSLVVANYIRGLDGCGFNNAFGGNPNLVNDGATVDAQLDSQYQMWLVVFAGTNDIWLAARTAAQTFADFQTYFNARVAAGWSASRIVVVTMLPRQATPANEASRITLNSSFRSNQGSMGYQLADIALDATIGLPGSQSNATYYAPDQIHLIDAGHALAAPYVEAQVSA